MLHLNPCRKVADRDASKGPTVSVIATVVDWAALGKVVLYSFAGAIGVTITTSLAILGAIRFADMRRDERVIEAGAFAILAAAAFAASVGAIILAIVVMVSK
jgi:hypothetical protein